MVSKKSREQLIDEFTQSYRLTGQLFIKLIQTVVRDESFCNMAFLPILKTLKQQGSLPQHAIARELHHSGAAISRQINLLLEDGLVSTRPDERNRRVTLVELTGEGDKVLGEMERATSNALSDILSAVSDEKLQQYIDDNNELRTIITPKLRKDPRV